MLSHISALAAVLFTAMMCHRHIRLLEIALSCLLIASTCVLSQIARLDSIERLVLVDEVQEWVLEHTDHFGHVSPSLLRYAPGWTQLFVGIKMVVFAGQLVTYSAHLVLTTFTNALVATAVLGMLWLFILHDTLLWARRFLATIALAILPLRWIAALILHLFT